MVAVEKVDPAGFVQQPAPHLVMQQQPGHRQGLRKLERYGTDRGPRLEGFMREQSPQIASEVLELVEGWMGSRNYGSRVPSHYW